MHDFLVAEWLLLLVSNIFYISITDGVGLLGGTINYFASCDNPPKVMLSTHLSEIFESGCLGGWFLDVHILAMDYTVHTCRNWGYKLPYNCTYFSSVKGPLGSNRRVSEEVVKRAASVLIATGDNKIVDRLLHENILAQDQQYKCNLHAL
ncbi:DNA mismatch repair protein MSH5 [Sesamum angolense]|uniref:DNA mismatch repair protein MSH5 n=1 Tax=Sesamum angolense TaxID=2727404 RepID=A0AAE2BUR7_9LAMI|nr:DNA mismatch repair protein MSH5 [Sesamum angolense]